MRNFGIASSILSVVLLSGCNGNSGSGGSSAGGGQDTPVFMLSWSEYPSWSVFGVADEEGILDGREGEMGEIEKKWNVDIVLNLRDYDTCISEYATSTTDAVCITNMDILEPSVSRPAVSILPTSTSDGADACLVVGIEDIDGLAETTTYGLAKSVSQFCFERVLEQNGKDPGNFEFANMDPDAAAKAMQLSQEGINSIVVWNPFVMETLRKQPKSKRLFDSSSIEEEIIDRVVVSKDSLAKPGGDRFAYAVLEAFYAVNELIADEATRDDTLVALGAKFSNLGLEDMKTVVTETKFYDTPDKAQALFEDSRFQSETMPAVAEFLVTHDMATTKPTFGFNTADAQLNFDSTYILGVKDGIDPAAVK